MPTGTDASVTAPVSQRPAVPPERFRANVMVVVVDERGEVLLCQRNDREGWQCVQGGVEPDEDLAEAAAREVFEEAGLVADGFDYAACEAAGALLPPPKKGKRAMRVDRSAAVVVDYKLRPVGELPLPEGTEPLRYRFPPGKCKAWVAEGIVGQEQRCFVFATSASAKLRPRVDLSGFGGQPREFIAADWHSCADTEGILRRVTAVKRDVFGRVCPLLADFFARATGAARATDATHGSATSLSPAPTASPAHDAAVNDFVAKLRAVLSES